MVFYILNVVAAFAGLLISLKVLAERSNINKPVSCPIGMKCDDVIRSKYNRMFGVPNEYLGVIYYSVIFAGYGIGALSGYVLVETVDVILVLMTVGAFLFSLYLTGIQAFILRAFCSWCLASAFVTLVIFVSTLLGTDVQEILTGIV